MLDEIVDTRGACLVEAAWKLSLPGEDEPDAAATAGEVAKDTAPDRLQSGIALGAAIPAPHGEGCPSRRSSDVVEALNIASNTTIQILPARPSFAHTSCSTRRETRPCSASHSADGELSPGEASCGRLHRARDRGLSAAADMPRAQNALRLPGRVAAQRPTSGATPCNVCLSRGLRHRLGASHNCEPAEETGPLPQGAQPCPSPPPHRSRCFSP